MKTHVTTPSYNPYGIWNENPVAGF
jgi:hypothetical protein